MGTKDADDITTLRNAVAWADSQNEDWWLPVDRRDPTPTQILALYKAMERFNVDYIEDLDYLGGDARAYLKRWIRNRGPK